METEILKGYISRRNNYHSTKYEVSTCRRIYYDKETRVMINQSVNEFYIRFLFKIDTLSQYAVFLLDIAANFSDNLSLEVIELLIS